MVPWGNAFTWDESLGYIETAGRYVDPPVLKYVDPNDPLIDFAYRNDWSAESLQLHFQPRSVRGGHAFEDRNHIVINALGRNWLTRNAYHKVDHENHSVLTIDGEGPNVQPAAVTQQFDLGSHALAVGDATDTYNWRTGKGNRPATWTLNDYRAQPSDDFMFDLPNTDHAHWQTAKRSHANWERFNQVEYVYRTAAHRQVKASTI